MAELKILTAKEVKDLLKIGEDKVYELLQKGEIKSVKVGGRYRIDYNDVMSFIESQKH